MPPAGTAVLALDIGATKLAAGVGARDGEVTRLATAPTNASEGAESVLARALELAHQVYTAATNAGDHLEAIGVSTMGYTHDDRVELATNVPGWTKLRIPEAIAKAFPDLPATIGNDVHVAAQAEMAWGSLKNVDDAIYLNLGSGISAGIVCGGRFLNGAEDAAGEVGYTLFRGRPEARMAADGIGPFEAYFGGAGAARRLADKGLPASVAETLELTATNPAAREFIDELWTGIAVMIVNMCAVLNPSVVSLGGGYVRGRLGNPRAHPGPDPAGRSDPAPDRARTLWGRRVTARSGRDRVRDRTPTNRRSTGVIVTVTANVAIDRTYEIDHLEVGAVHKVGKVFSHIGGKGVNVSRTLDALRAKTLITGLIGDATLDSAASELAGAGLNSALFPVSGATRQTVTVTAKDGTATAFDEAGPQITEAEWTGFELHFGTLLRDAGMVVIAGSLPPGTPNESLANLCQKANSHRVPVILDARGAAMRAAQNQAPLVAKLNRGELEQTLDRELTTEDDIVEGARDLHTQGAQNVIVTLGSDGAIGLNEHGVWRVTHPTAAGNPIGAGDAFSAALAIALPRQRAASKRHSQKALRRPSQASRLPPQARLTRTTCKERCPTSTANRSQTRPRNDEHVDPRCRPSKLAARLARVAGRPRTGDRTDGTPPEAPLRAGARPGT